MNCLIYLRLMHCYKCANTGLPLSFIWIQTEVFICAQEHLHTKFAVHENPVILRGEKSLYPTHPFECGNLHKNTK